MGVFRFFKMPITIRRGVINHYLNKIKGKKSSNELMGAKNLFKLFRLIPGLKVISGESEYTLTLATQPHRIEGYARKYPSSDLITMREVWGKHEYQPAMNILKKKINQPLNILDVGGNVGYSLLYFKHNFPQANIICVEPDPSNIQQIKKNISVNHLTGISIIEGALWSKRTRMELKNDYREGTSASFYVVESDHGNIEGYGIQDLLLLQNWKHIDFLKMDIEGAEKYLFEDDQVAAAILKNTKVLAIEIHDEKVDRQKIYDSLTSNRFNFFTKGETTFGENRDFLAEV